MPLNDGWTVSTTCESGAKTFPARQNSRIQSRSMAAMNAGPGSHNK